MKGSATGLLVSVVTSKSRKHASQPSTIAKGAKFNFIEAQQNAHWYYLKRSKDLWAIRKALRRDDGFGCVSLVLVGVSQIFISLSTIDTS